MDILDPAALGADHMWMRAWIDAVVVMTAISELQFLYFSKRFKRIDRLIDGGQGGRWTHLADVAVNLLCRRVPVHVDQGFQNAEPLRRDPVSASGQSVSQRLNTLLSGFQR